MLTCFFKLYSSWQWPNPIYLATSTDLSNEVAGWNPIASVQDSQHFMPILSPQIQQIDPTTTFATQSHVNTSAQIVQSTHSLTINEFKRAYNLIKKVAKRKLELKTLFTVPPQELHQFIFRIDLISISYAEDRSSLDYQHRRYVMAVEGKLRSLFVALETLGTSYKVRFRPFKGVELESEHVYST